MIMTYIILRRNRHSCPLGYHRLQRLGAFQKSRTGILG